MMPPRIQRECGTMAVCFVRILKLIFMLMLRVGSWQQGQQAIRKCQIVRKASSSARSWWEEEIGAPRFVSAPMVDQSGLAFRQLVRRYGVDYAYTPMLNCRVVAQGKKGYISSQFSTIEGDAPLAIQLAGSEPDIVESAAHIILDNCQNVRPAAFDINLGCPQKIAAKGKYGAFLFERDLNSACAVVERLCNAVNLPISVKVRFLPDGTEATIRACQKLIDSGASLITIHGRTRIQNKHLSGAADWRAMTKLLDALKPQVPIIANGGISCRHDAIKLLDRGFDAVMSSEALLDNPALFCDKDIPSRRDLCLELLDIIDHENTKTPFSFVRAHTFKLLHGSLSAFPQLRSALAVDANTNDDVRHILSSLDRLDPHRKFDLIGSSTHDHPTFNPRLSWYYRHRLNQLTPSPPLIISTELTAEQELDRVEQRLPRARIGKQLL